MAAERVRESFDAPTGRAPARMTVLEALRRELPIALLPVILLVGIAVAIGLARTPEYRSEARLNVGGLNLTQQSIQGYTAAVQQLAIAYARAIDATRVVNPVARELRIPPAEVVDRVSADPIQNSPVIRVRATAGNANDARRTADAAAESLVAYAVRLNSGGGASNQLRNRYKAAARRFRETNAAADRAQGPARDSLRTQADLAQLEMRTTGFLYQESQAGQATTGLVQQLAPATVATSDRGKILRDLIAGGAIAGILIGLGLAVMRANATARQRLQGT